MSVYVDQPPESCNFGRMKMCHMIADSAEELIAMVDHIGVQRKWFQFRASVPHFDIALGKRNMAVLHGAIPCTMRVFVGHMKRIKASWPRDHHGHWILE